MCSYLILLCAAKRHGARWRLLCAEKLGYFIRNLNIVAPRRGTSSCIILLKILNVDKFSRKLLTNAPSGATIRCNLCKWVIYALLRILYVSASADAKILKRRRKLCQPLTSS